MNGHRWISSVMRGPRLQPPVVVALIGVAAAAILVFDILLPLGVAASIPYVGLVLLGMWLPSPRHILVLAGIATVLTIIGYVLSPEGGILWVVLANRGLAVFLVWITAVLIIQYKKGEAKIGELNSTLSDANRTLEKEITRRQRAEEELRAYSKSLEQRNLELDAVNQDLEAFSYSVSHDLRAPLRSMDGFSHALLEDHGDKLDAKSRDHLQRVRAGSQKMAQLIDDLLKLSQVARGKCNHSDVDMSKMVRTIAARLQESEPERRVTFDIAPGVTAEADKRLIQIALENLLSNAWKFTAKHDHATIEFGVANHDGKAVYFVRDDGAGFDMAYADKLFKPFQRLHSYTEFGGSGIGLATVERITRRHGGRVWAESTIEQGTTVFFTL